MQGQLWSPGAIQPHTRQANAQLNLPLSGSGPWTILGASDPARRHSGSPVFSLVRDHGLDAQLPSRHALKAELPLQAARPQARAQLPEV